MGVEGGAPVFFLAPVMGTSESGCGWNHHPLSWRRGNVHGGVGDWPARRHAAVPQPRSRSLELARRRSRVRRSTVGCCGTRGLRRDEAASWHRAACRHLQQAELRSLPGATPHGVTTSHPDPLTCRPSRRSPPRCTVARAALHHCGSRRSQPRRQAARGAEPGAPCDRSRARVRAAASPDRAAESAPPQEGGARLYGGRGASPTARAAEDLRVSDA